MRRFFRLLFRLVWNNCRCDRCRAKLYRAWELETGEVVCTPCCVADMGKFGERLRALARKSI